MDSNIPIDIHYNKLLDWLLNRRHCPQQWQGPVLTIREKINIAIQDMPPVEEITTLLQGTYINYFHCLRIVELLKDTESGTKNIFGRYGSQRMKDWQEIVKLYEKDGVYLGEVAQLLTRNVNYEIPSLKKQISRCQQAQQDCSRKQSEYNSSAAELREKFSSSCKVMGIEGKKLRSELIALVQDMPASFDCVARATSNLQSAVQYYTDFVEFSLGRSGMSAGILPLLSYVMAHGNVTTYEYRMGKVPSRVEAVEMMLDEPTEEPAVGEDAEIDWGADADKIELCDDNDIDFGEENIDWGTGDDITIEVVGDDSNVAADVDPITLGTDDGVARGRDARTLLDNTKTRNLFIDELIELKSFLTQRVAEANADMDIVASTLLQSAPQSLQIDHEQLKERLALVNDVISQLTSKRTQELLLIRSSPRYVERLAGNLQKNLDDAEKLVLRSRLMVTRAVESLEEQKLTEPKLTLIRQRTQELKKEIEGEISKKYKDRPVNIMGEINTI